MPAPNSQAQHSLSEPWAPPSDGCAWWCFPAARRNHLHLLRCHNVMLFAEARVFMEAWLREIASDAEEHAA